MARLGSKARPLVLRVQSEDRAYAVAATCTKHGWKYIIGFEPGQPEDLRDLDKLTAPASRDRSAKLTRNGPCLCGSGKKYKRCCGANGALAPSGKPKLSEVIWDYAEPLTGLATGVEGTKKAAQLAIVCWNLAIYSGDGTRAAVETLLRESADGDQELQRELFATLEMMLKRKHTHFEDDDRVIFEYSFTDAEDGLALLVKSQPMTRDGRLPQDPVPT